MVLNLAFYKLLFLLILFALFVIRSHNQSPFFDIFGAGFSAVPMSRLPGRCFPSLCFYYTRDITVCQAIFEKIVQSATNLTVYTLSICLF